MKEQQDSVHLTEDLRGMRVTGPASLRTALDLTLTKEEAEGLASFIDTEMESDEDTVRLLIGDGHSGYGLYAACPEYPEEGAILVKSLPDHSAVDAAPATPDAWLRHDGMKAMPADEKEAWIEAGQPDIAEDYTIPLYRNARSDTPS